MITQWHFITVQGSSGFLLSISPAVSNGRIQRASKSNSAASWHFILNVRHGQCSLVSSLCVDLASSVTVSHSAEFNINIIISNWLPEFFSKLRQLVLWIISLYSAESLSFLCNSSSNLIFITYYFSDFQLTLHLHSLLRLSRCSLLKFFPNVILVLSFQLGAW